MSANKKYGYSIPFSNEGKKVPKFLESLKKNKNFNLLDIRSKNFTETRIKALKNLIITN